MKNFEVRSANLEFFVLRERSGSFRAAKTARNRVQPSNDTLIHCGWLKPASTLPRPGNCSRILMYLCVLCVLCGSSLSTPLLGTPQRTQRTQRKWKAPEAPEQKSNSELFIRNSKFEILH